MIRPLAVTGALAVLATAFPASAQTTYYVVRPGYGFNGAYEQTVRQTEPPTYVGTYTYTPQGYVYTGPVYSYTPAPASVDPGPALSKNAIEDLLDDRGYDDIKVGEYAGGFYMVRAKDKAAQGDRRKVLLTVDARTGDVVRSEPRRD